MKFLFIFFKLLALSSIVPTQTSQAAIEFATEEQYYVNAKALVINQFAGQLKIKTASQKGIQIKMTGPKRRIKTVRTTLTNNETLVVQDTPSQHHHETIVGNGNRVVVYSGNGGQATVEINGQIIQSGPNTTSDEPPLATTLAVAASVPVTIERFVGNAVLAKGVNIVKATHTSGDITLVETQDTTLDFNGSGTMTIQQAKGDLTINVAGSGSAVVDRGDIKHLQAHIDGSGDISIFASVESATLSVNGSGSIFIDNVENKPTITIHGSGDISVGNW